MYLQKCQCGRLEVAVNNGVCDKWPDEICNYVFRNFMLFFLNEIVFDTFLTG